MKLGFYGTWIYRTWVGTVFSTKSSRCLDGNETKRYFFEDILFL